MTWVAGVDGCRGGWLAALVEVGQTRAPFCTLTLYTKFADLLNIDPRPAVIAIDIPIGLLDAPKPGGRICDQEARRMLGRRGCSVFSPPIRTLLDAGSYEQVRSLGVTRQSFGILPKIREVDRLMTPHLQNTFHEAHPELAFCALTGGQPTRESKKTRAGREERMSALEHLPVTLFGGNGRNAMTVLDKFPRTQVAPDDVLDACVLTWTALRIVEGQGQRIPTDPPIDRKRLRMEIWY